MVSSAPLHDTNDPQETELRLPPLSSALPPFPCPTLPKALRPPLPYSRIITSIFEYWLLSMPCVFVFSFWGFFFTISHPRYENQVFFSKLTIVYQFGRNERIESGQTRLESKPVHRGVFRVFLTNAFFFSKKGSLVSFRSVFVLFFLNPNFLDKSDIR